jgi:hypothetical protein
MKVPTITELEAGIKVYGFGAKTAFITAAYFFAYARLVPMTDADYIFLFDCGLAFSGLIMAFACLQTACSLGKRFLLKNQHLLK